MRRGTDIQTPPIGLDLGGASIKLLQLERSGGGVAVRAAAKQTWPAAGGLLDGKSLTPALQAVTARMLDRGRFEGRRVVASLPRELLRLRTVRLPVLPPDQLEDAALGEAKRLFPFAADELVVQFLPVGPVRQAGEARLEVILLIAVQSEVDRFVDALDGAGLVVESIDVEQCALYRTVERFLPPGDRDAHVLIDVGARQTQVVMGRGADITFIKSIEVGSEQLNSAVSRKLDVSQNEARDLRRRLNESLETNLAADAGDRESIRHAVADATRGPLEQLAREMARFLRYHAVAFRGRPPQRVRVVGGESSDPHLIAVLNDAVPLPVEAAFPLAPVKPGKMLPAEYDGPMGDWAVALGLALKKTTGPLEAESFAGRDSGIAPIRRVRPLRPVRRREVAVA